MDLGGFSLTPYGAVEATLYRLPDDAETADEGSPFALDFDAQSQTAVRTELGARTAVALGSGVTLTGRAAWVWNAERVRALTPAFQALPGTSFTVYGAEPAAHAALVDLGLHVNLAANVAANLNFAGEFSQNVTSYSGQAKIAVTW
jgi:uncharacterized protein with beta-barrel porin domain